MPQHSHTGNNFKLFFTFTNDLTISHDLVKIDRPYKKPKKTDLPYLRRFFDFSFFVCLQEYGLQTKLKGGKMYHMEVFICMF